MKTQILTIVERRNITRFAFILAVSFAVVAGFCVWQSPNSSAAKSRANRPTFKSNTARGNFNIKFDYSKAEDPSLFTNQVKEEIEASARLLESFIGNSHEVVMIVVSDENMKGAYASAAPSEWQQGTEDNPIEKPLVTKGGIRFNASSLRKSDGDESSNVALTAHELLHALGFVRSGKAFAAHVKDGKFHGPVAMKMNGGKPIPLSSDGHFPQGFKDPVGVEPRLNVGGGGSYFSAVEFGVLADIGYDVPIVQNADDPMFLNYKLDSRYADKQSDGSYLLDGTGGNDVIYAGKGKGKIRGAGGDDILVSGDGETQMYGDDPAGMPEDYRSGKDGKDTFVVRDKKNTYQIHDLGADDALLISPSVGVTKEEMEEAMKDPAKFTMNRTGGYLLEVGEFKIIIGTKDGKKPASLDNVEIKDWSAN